MSYNVYTAQYQGKPNHVAIFVETDPGKSGALFHVVGNILRGMEYETRKSNLPDISATFVRNSKVHIGVVHRDDLHRLEAVCETVPVPGAQLKLNGDRLDRTKPVRRCGEWVKEAKEKLVAEGIVKKT